MSRRVASPGVKPTGVRGEDETGEATPHPAPHEGIGDGL